MEAMSQAHAALVAQVETLQAALAAERDKHDEEAYNLMSDAVETLQASIDNLKAERERLYAAIRGDGGFEAQVAALRAALTGLAHEMRGMATAAAMAQPDSVLAGVITRWAHTLDAVLAQAQGDATPAVFDFRAHLQRQREFSERTFGPGTRTQGIIDHITKELREIEADETDISEWIDVTILALDGAWRAGYAPEAIIAALVAKQAKNEARAWPDWRTVPEGKAIEHVRGEAQGQP